MAYLQFDDFALTPGPVKTEEQFRQPDNFSKTDFTFLSRSSDRASGFPAVL